MLFNSLISDLNYEIKDTLMKLGDDTKLKEEVDTLEGRATLLDRLKEQMNKNLMKDKCNTLFLGKHNPGLYHRLGSTQTQGWSWWTNSLRKEGSERTLSLCPSIYRMATKKMETPF